MPTLTREAYRLRIRNQVTNRTFFVSRLEEFVAFDPEAKPLVDTFLKANAVYVDQLKARGVEPHEPRAWTETPLEWAHRFARSKPYADVLEYAKLHDKALVPFTQAHCDTLEALRAHVKSRVEKLA